MDSRGAKFFEYCVSIAKEFQSRLNRMRVFVHHNLTSGTANEIILRDFLAKHAAGDFGVSQGFICEPSYEGAVSRQCDILVYYKNHYPLVYADASIDVVWPQAVAMVIEVKTSLGKKDLAAAIDNIRSAALLNSNIEGMVFAFKSAGVATVLKNLQNYSKSIEVDQLPRAILLLDKGVIIHNWGWARDRLKAGSPYSDANLRQPYSIREAKRDKGAVVIAFLLFLFFQAMQSGRGLQADFINALNDILEEHTSSIDLPNCSVEQASASSQT